MAFPALGSAYADMTGRADTAKEMSYRNDES
jgi:hypothetical protein